MKSGSTSLIWAKRICIDTCHLLPITFTAQSHAWNQVAQSAWPCPMSSKGIGTCKRTLIIVLFASQLSHQWFRQASAVRLGLCCVAAVPLVAEHWPGYRLRRHHNGRSFADKIQKSFHYCFRRYSYFLFVFNRSQHDASGKVSKATPRCWKPLLHLLQRNPPALLEKASHVSAFTIWWTASSISSRDKDLFAASASAVSPLSKERAHMCTICIF